MNVLTKLKGIWFGDLDGKRVVIIDVDQADIEAMKIIDDFIKERRLTNERRNAASMVWTEAQSHLEV